MKPARFEYHAPETVEQAVALLDAYGDNAKVLAGGQGLVPMINIRLARPGYQNIVRAVAAAAEVRAPAGAGSPPAPTEAAAPTPRTTARSAGQRGRSDLPEDRRLRG